MGDLSDESYEKQMAYWAALGRFIHYFSQVEQKLQSILWHITGTSLEVARAAFQDARYGAIVTLINRIGESSGTPENAYYRLAIDHLGPINRMRNDIVHLGPLLEGDQAVISTGERAIPGKGKQMTVSADLLDQMCSDLLTIMACLSVFNLDLLGTPDDDLKKQYWKQTVEMRSWHYRPPSQSDAARGRRKPPPKR